MKIVILTPTIDETRSGGVERFSFYLLKVFSGHTTVLIGKEHFSWLQEKIYDFSRFIGLQQPILGYFLGSISKKQDADVYITNGLLGWNITQGRVINIQHSTFAKAAIRVDKDKNFFKYLMKRYVWGYFEKLAALHASTVVAVSNETKESVQTLYHVNQVTVIPNAIDTDFFIPQDKILSRKKAEIDVVGPIGLFVGRFEYAKGKDILIDLQSFFEQQRGKLIIAEHFSQEELATLYAAADVFVLPSLHEGCSYALLEAMSCGTPFVASAVGLAADLSSIFPMCVIADATAEAYRNAVQRLLSLSGEEQQALSDRIRAYTVDHYGLSVFKKAYRALI